MKLMEVARKVQGTKRMTSEFVDNPSGASAFDEVLTAEQIAHLKEHWIETVEQFLSAVATEEGKVGVRNLLALDESQLDDCVKRLAEKLPPDVVEQLQSTKPGGELGANLPQQPTDQNDAEGGSGA